MPGSRLARWRQPLRRVPRRWCRAVGLGASIISYDGRVRFGLITDRGLCPDPEQVVARFAGEFEKLVLTALMCAWGHSGDLDPERAARAVGVT